jgi:hypothetical protein
MTTCSQAALASRALDAELGHGFPASDPPSVTQPYGDPRDAAGCGWSINAEKAPKLAGAARREGCCGGKGVEDGS